MTAYASQIASVKRVIKARGEKCVWRSAAAPAATDPTQPWIETVAAPAVETDAHILFTPITRINSQLMRHVLAQGGQPGGNVMGLMASVSFDPTLAGVVVRSSGAVLAVRSADPLAPDGTPILWTLEFEA